MNREKRASGRKKGLLASIAVAFGIVGIMTAKNFVAWVVGGGLSERAAEEQAYGADMGLITKMIKACAQSDGTIIVDDRTVSEEELDGVLASYKGKKVIFSLEESDRTTSAHQLLESKIKQLGLMFVVPLEEFRFEEGVPVPIPRGSGRDEAIGKSG